MHYKPNMNTSTPSMDPIVFKRAIPKKVIAINATLLGLTLTGLFLGSFVFVGAFIPLAFSFGSQYFVWYELNGKGLLIKSIFLKKLIPYEKIKHIYSEELNGLQKLLIGSDSRLVYVQYQPFEEETLIPSEPDRFLRELASRTNV